MNCDHFRNLIVKQLASSADAAEAESVRTHLESCEACRQYRNESAATWSELDCLADKHPEASRVGEIMNRIATAPATKARKTKAPPAGVRDWKRTALAAGVLLVLAAGLFAMVARHEPVVVVIKRETPADGDKDKKSEPPKPETPDFGLTAAEVQEINIDIVNLESDDFAVRDAATNKLIAMGSKIKPFLAARLDKPDSKDSENLRHGLKMAIAGIEKLETDQAIAEATRDLDKAVDEAPAHFIPPDPGVIEKLKTRVTFDFVDKSLSDSLDFVSEAAKLPIFIDPVVKTESVPNLNLHVTQMSADLALDWILKLAGCDKVVRGKVVIISTTERADKLGSQKRSYTLPAPSDGTAWTEEETKQLIPFLKQCTGDAGERLVDITCTMEKAGAVSVYGSLSSQSMVEKFLPSLTTERLLPIPAWADEIEHRLDDNLDVEFDHARLDEAVNSLNTHIKINIILDPTCSEMVGNEIDYHAGKRSFRDLLLMLCEQVDLIIEPENQCLFLTKSPNLDKATCVIDLTAALNAHIPVDDLRQKLGPLCSTARIIHNRWYAVLDPWTCQRAVKVVEAAAKTGKVQELPPEAWFFKTFKLRADSPKRQRPVREVPKTPDLDGNPDGDDGKIVPRVRIKK
jgi:hypothetical protein